MHACWSKLNHSEVSGDGTDGENVRIETECNLFNRNVHVAACYSVRTNAGIESQGGLLLQ